MNIEMMFLLIVMVGMFVGLLFEVARPALIVFFALVVLLLTGILTPKEALSGFSNEGMLTIALLFIVAGSVQKSGLIDVFMKRLLNGAKSRLGTMMRFLLPVSIMSAFLNNTPIVVTFTPVIKKWCEEHDISPSKFLIPLSYVTILGGMITLIGTSTNLVVHGMLLEYGYKGFSLFTTGIVAIPVAIVGMFYIFIVGYHMLPANKGFSKQVKEDVREYIAEMVVTRQFKYVGKSIKEAGLRELKGLYLIKIIRGEEHLSPVGSSTVIQLGDRLIFTGLISTIADLQNIKGLQMETGIHISLDELHNASSHLVEAVVSHQSSLLTKSIKESRFRSRYDAGVIAVHRNNERIKSKVGDINLKPGDTLLLLAGTDFVHQYQGSNDFYVVSSIDTPDSLRQNKAQGWLSLGILLTMIVIVALGFLSMFKAMALAVILLLVTRALSADETKKYIRFNVLLLIASALGIGVAMTKTGLASWIADVMIHFGQPLGFLAIVFIVYITTNIFTELITNSAAAALMLPIGIEIAQNMNVDPIGFAVTIAIAASASFITPIGYQTNLIVYGPGGYKFTDYIKVGLPLSFLVMVTSVSVIYLVWF